MSAVLTALMAFAGPVVLDDATKAKLREVAFQAAREGDAKTLTEYFKVGMPANVANDRGDTLLILAVYHGHADAAGVILKQPKVGVSARNKMGFTALDGAAFKGSAALVKALVKAGADVNGRSVSGRTALMLAALTNRHEAAKALLEAGADAAAKDEKGNTALSVARSQDAAEVVKLLEAARKR